MDPDADWCDSCLEERGVVTVLAQATRRARFRRSLVHRLNELEGKETA